MPCPLLLTKDGDTQAERVISQQISRQDVDVYTDTYVSFAEYVDTVFGWYGTSTDEFNALSNDSRLDTWYNWYSLNYDLKDELILDLDGFYLSDRAIDESQKSATTITPIKVNASRDIEDWDTEIIRWIDTDYDFYGIILGGTAAVSNDKRDDLDDAVVFTGGTQNVATVGTALPDTVVRFSNDWGIELNYSKLNYIDTVTCRNRLAGWYEVGNVADVYAIRGTDSYVIYIHPDAATAQPGRFMYVYRGAANTGFTTDWI
jgi:hypothetical protein